jgi:hypothetical protein
MLDRDLARLYGVATKALNRAVKRNIGRFPEDFVFQLTRSESENLRYQIGTANLSAKSRTFPYVFTEHGVAMLSSVLNSDLAIQINIRIMRAFVEARQAIAAKDEYVQLRDQFRRIESEVQAIKTSQMVGEAIIERKLTAMSTDLRRVSEALDQFQDAYLVIKRPPDDGGMG